jgi:uncharacterized protein YdhG (YjbR/CyaY superfamily)
MSKQKTVRSTRARFTDEEKSAMKERAQELKRVARGGGQADEEDAVLAKIAEMPESDRVLGERLHALIKASAPSLSPKLWYGMPAYYGDGKVICHFQCAQKFKTRYATLGFSEAAHLDEGDVWPVAYALKELSAAAEARVTDLLKRALS